MFPAGLVWENQDLMDPDDVIIISRQGLELGKLPGREAAELLRAEFLLPTDEFWTNANPERRQLSELNKETCRPSPGWLQRAKTSVVATTGVVVQGAGHVTSKVSRTILGGPSLVSAVMTKVLDDYAPTLRERIGNQLKTSVQTTQAALRDEVFLRKLFGAVYDCLPKPVHRFVSEQVFIEYCFKHRRKLLKDGPLPVEPGA